MQVNETDVNKVLSSFNLDKLKPRPEQEEGTSQLWFATANGSICVKDCIKGKVEVCVCVCVCVCACVRACVVLSINQAGIDLNRRYSFMQPNVFSAYSFMFVDHVYIRTWVAFLQVIIQAPG